jgi:hypothetical protein
VDRRVDAQTAVPLRQVMDMLIGAAEHAPEVRKIHSSWWWIDDGDVHLHQHVAYCMSGKTSRYGMVSTCGDDSSLVNTRCPFGTMLRLVRWGTYSFMQLTSHTPVYILLIYLICIIYAT